MDLGRLLADGVPCVCEILDPIGIRETVHVCIVNFHWLLRCHARSEKQAKANKCPSIMS